MRFHFRGGYYGSSLGYYFGGFNLQPFRYYRCYYGSCGCIKLQRPTLVRGSGLYRSFCGYSSHLCGLYHL